MSPLSWFHRLHARFNALEPIEKTFIKLALLAGAMIALAISLTIAFVSLATSQHSDHNSSQAVLSAKAARDIAQADCETWRDLSSIPPSATTTPSGLQLFADFRISYARKGCVDLLGELPKADPRIVPLLPPGVH